MKKNFFCLVMLLFCLIIMSGCGQVAVGNDNSSIREQQETSQAIDMFKEYSYVSLEREEPNFTYDSVWEVTGYLEEVSYTFQTYYFENTQRYFLEKYNQISTHKEQTELMLTDTETPFGSILCVDVLYGEKVWLLFAETDSAGREIIQYFSIELDSNGNIVSKVPLADTYQVQEGNLQPDSYRVDENGYCFILNSDRTMLYVFDEEGNSYSVKEYSNPIQEEIQGSCHTTDNQVFWVIGSQEKGTADVVQYMPEKKDFVEQASFDNWGVEYFCVTDENHIYYIMNQQLIKWDRTSDEQKVIFSFLESRIPMNKIQSIGVSDQGDILLYVQQTQEREIYVLSNKEQEIDEDGLIIANLTKFGSNYVKACAAGFSRENPDIVIEYDSATGDRDDYYNRIMAELVSGNGPDMLWVSKEDMQTLYEKDMLQDLTILLSTETREQVFSGVLQAGTIEETYVGLCPDTYPIVLMTSDKLWEKDSWDFEEFFQLLSDAQPCGILVNYGMETGFNKKQNLTYTTLLNLSYSPYVDLASGKSKLSEEAFNQVLEAINLYSGNTTYDGESNPVMEGGYIAQLCDISNISIFSTLMKEYDEACHFVGFPGQTDDIGYWMASDFLVVNNQSDKQEEIALFMEYLLEKENQKSVDFNSVRKDVIRENVYIEEFNNKAYYRTDYGSYNLEMKEDGSTYLEEYLQCLENCGPKPHSLDDIEDIISQEAEAYFNDERDLEQTTDIIHNRVQLYLDEQK